jgi:hypothetical protein
MIKTGIVVAILAILLAGITAQADPMFFPLSQHSMAKDIGPSGEPLYRSYTFSQDDLQAVSWLKVWKDLEIHPVEWRWYSPNGRVYARSFGVIPAVDSQGFCGACIWSALKISGYEVSLMPGTWKVDVIVDFRKVLTEYFTLNGHHASCC